MTHNYHSPTKSYHSQASSPNKLEHLPTQMSILAASEHRTHNGWLKKIHALWDQINAQKSYDEVLRVEAGIKENGGKLKGIKLENMRENARCLAL